MDLYSEKKKMALSAAATWMIFGFVFISKLHFLVHISSADRIKYKYGDDPIQILESYPLMHSILKLS